MKKIKSIHFVSIKGVGMTPLAIIAKEAGIKVTGSDVEDTFITDAALLKSGIHPEVGFDSMHVLSPDLIITSGANGGFDNIEVITAKQKNIPVITQGQAVGEYINGSLFGKKYIGISVAGSHGKTTTTAMLATVLSDAKLDPSYVIGTSSVDPLGLPGHFGKGKYFVAEADEYATEPKYDKTPKLFWQKSKIVVFTNIEFDHPDLYPTLESIEEAFLRFANMLPNNGVLIACGDDIRMRNLLKRFKGKVKTYGFSEVNDYVIKNIHVEENQTFFDVFVDEIKISSFMIRVAGEHNSLNATAVLLVGLELNLPIEKIKNGLVKFSGTKRRLEFIRRLSSGAMLFDDYAHHPTEIKKTLLTVHQEYPKSKIICIFQPHTYSRTKKLFEEFISSFNNASTVIITDIYASQREEKDPSISSKLLVEKMSTIHPQVIYEPKLIDVVQYLNKNQFGKDTIVLTMGAGDVYKVKDNLQ